MSLQQSEIIKRAPHMKFDLPIGDTNPIEPALNHSSFPHSQSLQTDFLVKVPVTFEVLASLFLYATGGIFILTGYLQLVCESVRKEAEEEKLKDPKAAPDAGTRFKRIAANTFYYPLLAINFVVAIVQFVVLIPLTVVCLPFIALAEGISKLVRAAKAHTADSMQVTVNDTRAPSTTLSLKELLKTNKSKHKNLAVTKVEKRPIENDYKITFSFRPFDSSTKRLQAVVKDNNDPGIKALAQINYLVCSGLDKAHFFDDEKTEISPSRR